MFGLFRKKKKKAAQKVEQPVVKEEVVEEKVELEEDVHQEEVTAEPIQEDVQEEEKEEVEEKEESPKPRKRKAIHHVTKHKDGGWQVKKEGAQRALKRFGTQKEAIEYAKQIEKERGVGFIIHKADGSTRKKTY